MTMTTIASPPRDYSLVAGGPLYRLYRRARLSGDDLQFVQRRMLVMALIAWVPLLILSILEGRGFGGGIRIPFLYDVEAHARFLVALPALVLAEVVVHRRVTPVVQRFVDRRLVAFDDLPRFNAAIDWAQRARNSVSLEVALLVLVYTAGLWIWRNEVALGEASWYALPEATGLRLTLAGYWYAFLSIPIFHFILLRWYARLVLWFGLLWRVSRLNLHLSAAHPDRSGGIGFVGTAARAFQPVLFAQGALLSGLIASQVLYRGQSLLSFKMEAAGLVVLMVLIILGPLAVFTPQLDRTRRQAAAEYGLLAARYAFGFEEKWLRGGGADSSDLLGSADLQSLADLGNSYGVVREMRLVPFGMNDITRLAVATAVPLLPLTLTLFSVEELVTRLVKILF